jgi:hypothetical protein
LPIDWIEVAGCFANGKLIFKADQNRLNPASLLPKIVGGIRVLVSMPKRRILVTSCTARLAQDRRASDH